MPAHPEHNLLTTNGVTHGLDLIARHLVKPGDTVLVEDPAWFVIFGRLAAFGARLIGVPRGPDGPDIALLEQLAAQHKPKLFIVNSAVHNPTGHTLSAGAAYGILRIAERHDFMVVEDDTYGELHPGGAMKLAALDRLNRVILVSGYSKMLAASLRVGYVAANPDILQKLADLKMLAGLTSPELGERVVHRVLMEGQYRRHIERVRLRVDDARQRCMKGLLKLGLTVHHEPHAGHVRLGGLRARHRGAGPPGRRPRHAAGAGHAVLAVAGAVHHAAVFGVPSRITGASGTNWKNSSRKTAPTINNTQLSR